MMQQHIPQNTVLKGLLTREALIFQSLTADPNFAVVTAVGVDPLTPINDVLFLFKYLMSHMNT